jgi:hypothetical protein
MQEEREMKISKIVATISLLAATSVAGAAVILNYDSSGAFNGTGFVGKGDVQLAFGWNNKQLQDNASGVSFAYSATARYSATCVWVTGEGTRGEHEHTISRTVTSKLVGSVAYDARVRNQITGFNLTGFQGEVTSVGKVPEVGGTCPGNGTDGAWTVVTLSGSEEKLTASFGGINADLSIGPIL